MTATCREACCSVTPRVSVAELFDRGFRRNHAEPLSIAGAPCADAEGNSARYSLELAGGKLAAIGFRATSCATLIAYCELIAEMVPGFSIEIAEGLSVRDLIGALAGVPEFKQPRAALAVAAFRAALTEARSRQ